MTPERQIETGARNCAAGVGTFEARRLFDAYTKVNKNDPFPGLCYIPLTNGIGTMTGAVKIYEDTILGTQFYGYIVLRREGDWVYLDYDASNLFRTQEEFLAGLTAVLNGEPVDIYDDFTAVCVKAYQFPEEGALSRFVFAEEWKSRSPDESEEDWYAEHRVGGDDMNLRVRGAGQLYPGDTFESRLFHALSIDLWEAIEAHWPTLYGRTMEDMGVEIVQTGRNMGWMQFRGLAHWKQWSYGDFLRFFRLQQFIHEWVAEHSQVEKVIASGQKYEVFYYETAKGFERERHHVEAAYLVEV